MFYGVSSSLALYLDVPLTSISSSEWGWVAPRRLDYGLVWNWSELILEFYLNGMLFNKARLAMPGLPNPNSPLRYLLQSGGVQSQLCDICAMYHCPFSTQSTCLSLGTSAKHSARHFEANWLWGNLSVAHICSCSPSQTFFFRSVLCPSF